MSNRHWVARVQTGLVLTAQAVTVAVCAAASCKRGSRPGYLHASLTLCAQGPAAVLGPVLCLLHAGSAGGPTASAWPIARGVGGDAAGAGTYLGRGSADLQAGRGCCVVGDCCGIPHSRGSAGQGGLQLQQMGCRSNGRPLQLLPPCPSCLHLCKAACTLSTIRLPAPDQPASSLSLYIYTHI